MSLWYEIKDQDDVSLSDDGKTIYVCFNGNHNGNIYVEIPVGFVIKAILQNEPPKFKPVAYLVNGIIYSPKDFERAKDANEFGPKSKVEPLYSAE